MIETDADLRTRLLVYLAQEHTEQAQRKEAINAAEWDAALVAAGTDLDKLAGIHGLVRRGGDCTTPSPWKTVPQIVGGMIDCWLRVVDYDDETIVLAAGHG